MTRNKPYYSKAKLRELISNGKVHITHPAKKSAYDDFGWGEDDIYKAILALPVSAFYKSDLRFNNPTIWVDYYRAYNLKGEDVYSHFYVEGNVLIIDSFKRI